MKWILWMIAMISPNMPLRSSIVLFKRIFIASLLVTCAPIHAAVEQAPSSEGNKAAIQESNPVLSPNNLEIYHLIQEIVKTSAPSESHNIEILKSKLESQEEKIRKLEQAVKDLSIPQSNDTATIVLAAVSVIITVLGVLVAILSILGYSNIKKEAIKSSQETAQATIEAVAKNGLQEATEKSLINLIEAKRFDAIIQDAVANIAFRGISIPDGINDDEEKPL